VSRTSGRRRLIAVPLALALLAGASLLTAAPASAAVGITILTPTEGATLDSHVQVFTGVTAPDATVTATLGQVTLPATTAAANGEFSIEVAFTYFQSGVQTVTFAGTDGDVTIPSVSRTVNIVDIEPALVDELVPLDENGYDDELVTARGSGRPGFIATVRFTPLSPLAATPTQINTPIGADGRWEATTLLAPGGYRVSSWHSEELSTGAAFMVSVPVEAWTIVVDLPAPVISAASVSSDGTVRVFGTGTPGQQVQVDLTSARLHDATEEFWADYEFDPSDFITSAPNPVVDAAGNWSVDIALPGTNVYYAVAYLFDSTNGISLSNISNEVRFGYVVPVAQLAATGAEPAGQIGLGASLLVGGGLLLLVGRRRTASGFAIAGSGDRTARSPR